MSVAQNISPELEPPRRDSHAAVIVAIDGPGASGKSSTARELAKLLGFLYVDTGAMYRTLAWHCLRKKVDVTNARSVGAACRKWRTSLAAVEGQVRLLVEGRFPGDAIRTAEVTEAASKIAVVPAVRKWMKLTQRECRNFGNLVMEGRDIGTNVFPETNFKFFLDASAAVRATRREAEGRQEKLPERDHRDSQRREAPLMVSLGAVRIDNSDKTLAQTVGEIVVVVEERMQASLRAARV